MIIFSSVLNIRLGVKDGGFNKMEQLPTVRRLTSKCLKRLISVSFNFEENRIFLARLQPRSETSRPLVLGYCMQKIWKRHLENMQQLCKIYVVENKCNNTPTEIVRKSVNIN